MDHFLSYILPCYNYSEVIEEALDSIFQQNLSIPFEVICTDDCSTDKNTRRILKNWESSHENFHVYFREETGGECVANNLSVRHSKGDIIFCLDTDNVLAPYSINGLVEHLDNTGCEGVCFEELRFFTGSIQKGDFNHRSSWFFKAPGNVVDLQSIISNAGETPASSGNYLFTRKSYDRAGGYPEGNVMGSWSFGFRQHATGSRIAILPGTFYWHRYSDGGMYLTNQAKGLNAEAVMRTALEFPEIYTRETWELMKTADCKSRFLQYCDAGKIKLRNPLICANRGENGR